MLTAKCAQKKYFGGNVKLRHHAKLCFFSNGIEIPGIITQVTLFINVMRCLSNIVTVTNLILRIIITTSNEVTNLVSNPLSN